MKQKKTKTALVTEHENYLPIGRSGASGRRGRSLKYAKAPAGTRAKNRGHEYGRTCKPRWEVTAHPRKSKNIVTTIGFRTRREALARRVPGTELPKLVVR